MVGSIEISSRSRSAESWLASWISSYQLRIGRRRLIVPLHRVLASTVEGKARARQIFAKAREGYHAITQTAVEQALR